MKAMPALVVVLSLLVVALVAMLWVSTPKPWPVSQGTLKAKKVSVDGHSFVMIDGDAMNMLGQIQSINVELDEDSKKLIVDRCIVRWNPFSKIIVNNQWPVFYPLDSAKPGKYSVVYHTKEGEATAGNFDVP